MTNEPTLFALNDNSIFRLDPRVNTKSKLVQEDTINYSSKPQLSVGTTTEEGLMAVGSNTGEIRLFNQKLKRAKTNLPGFGDPIIGIDVTADGKWILATCKTYLLVIPAELPGGQLGFNKAMGQEKPIPRRLQLKPEHIRMIKSKINFTPAHFNTGADKESWILTSTGKFLITWNFRKVKQNVLQDYQIKEYGDLVVADQFRYNKVDSLIVTMPDNVKLTQRAIKK